MQNLQQNKIFECFRNVLFIAFLLSTFIHSEYVFSQKIHTIVLDAGHGGKDPGNMGNNYREKSIALSVALLVGNELKNHKEIKVIYTRKKDVFVDLWKRGDIANQARADLFVSIHCDSHTSNAYGAGTFVLGLRGNKKNLEIAKRENAVILLEDNFKDRYKGFDPNSAESVIGLSLLQEENLDKSLAIASHIQNNFVKQLKRHDRRVKQDNFQVLRETIMPSVLVELGFLTNKKEGRYLNSKKGQLQMSKAISKAILSYLDNLKKNTIPNTGITKTKEKTNQKNINTNKEVITFKVQIAAGKNKLSVKSSNFKGLPNVERLKVKSLYKYYYKSTSNYKKAKEYL